MTTPGLDMAMRKIYEVAEQDGAKPAAKQQAMLIAPTGTHRKRVDAFASYMRACGDLCDIDDMVCAIGALCHAVGIKVRFIREQVGNFAWTVHIEAKMENGKWYRP